MEEFEKEREREIEREKIVANVISGRIGEGLSTGERGKGEAPKGMR
jgi:hypothetical protein